MQHTTAPDLLLETARRAIQRGQIERARAVLRALTAQYPNDVRVWEALADVAADQQERRFVLEQLATQHIPIIPISIPLAETPSDQQSDVLHLPAPVTLMPRDLDNRSERASIRWPTYLVIGLTVAIVALIALWRWTPIMITTTDLAATQVVASAPLPTLAASMPAAAVLPTLPHDQPVPTWTPAVATTILASTTPSPPPTIAPTATPRPSLSLEKIVQSGSWDIALLRPEHALLLDGSIGALQPQGRFVLALLAIGNTGTVPARIPEELVVLQDEQGNRYMPIPAASTTYLTIYGRGQSGDLSFDEPIPVDAGNLSVPILFDVPPNARGLQIVVGNAPIGWIVSGS